MWRPEQTVWRGQIKEKVMLTNLVLNLNKKDEDATIESTRAWWDDNPDSTLIDIEEEVRRQIREREQQGRKGKK